MSDAAVDKKVCLALRNMKRALGGEKSGADALENDFNQLDVLEGKYPDHNLLFNHYCKIQHERYVKAGNDRKEKGKVINDVTSHFNR
jgi:hypothetical protein